MPRERDGAEGAPGEATAQDVDIFTTVRAGVSGGTGKDEQLAGLLCRTPPEPPAGFPGECTQALRVGWMGTAFGFGWKLLQAGMVRVRSELPCTYARKGCQDPGEASPSLPSCHTGTSASGSQGQQPAHRC